MCIDHLGGQNLLHQKRVNGRFSSEQLACIVSISASHFQAGVRVRAQPQHHSLAGKRISQSPSLTAGWLYLRYQSATVGEIEDLFREFDVAYVLLDESVQLPHMCITLCVTLSRKEELHTKLHTSGGGCNRTKKNVSGSLITVKNSTLRLSLKILRDVTGPHKTLKW